MEWIQGLSIVVPILLALAVGFFFTYRRLGDMNKRFEEVHHRIDDLRSDMNQRFSDVNQRLSEMHNEISD